MKLLPLFVALFFLSRGLLSCNRSGPVNNNVIGDINACDSEIFVRNWEITRPVIMDSSSEIAADSSFKDTLTRDQGDNMASYADFISAYDEPAADTSWSVYTPFVRYPYKLDGSYFFVNNYYPIPDRPSMLFPVIPALVYAAAVLTSDREQDVIFISGANNGLRLWLNGKSILRQFTNAGVQGYQYVMKVHLKKGENFMLAKLSHVTGDWKFFLKIASLRYANENALGENYSSICEHYLIKTGDSLRLKLWVPQIRAEKPALLRVMGLDGQEVLSRRFDPARHWTVDIKALAEGPYAVDLTTDDQVFRQYIFYGDYEKYFLSIKRSIEAIPARNRFTKNVALLVSRMGYVDTVPVTHDNEYERKMTRVLYEMSDMYRHYKKGDELFADVPGLHLRCQPSAFYASETYMIYVPTSYSRTRPIPLVMMLPHETGIREFTISTYVSDINRIEHIMQLANRYEFAVVWSSYRVYSNHNLTRMFPDLVAKTLQCVKKDYAIDDNRVYAYGDCGGGELALFLANKYPDFFAAVGVEGPAIPDKNGTEGVQSRFLGHVNFDFYNTIINYRNFPTMIIHSMNDEKTSFEHSAELCEEISRLGGKVRLEPLHVRKGTDFFFSDLMPDNKILNDLFGFYNGKVRRMPDTVWLSTYQLKYNHAFWVTIDGLIPGLKAEITAVVNRAGHSVSVDCSDVTAFSLDVHDLRLDPTKKITVTVNGKLCYNDLVRGDRVTIHPQPADTFANDKNSLTEGPINDFFTAPFLVVMGTRGTTPEQLKWRQAIDTLRKSWATDFLRDAIPCEPDRAIGGSDLKKYNLVLIGADSDNPVLHRIWQQLPLKVSGDAVQIGTQKYAGKDLSYILIYPNPLNRDKYVLVIGSNAPRISSKVLVDLTYDGWSDYQIYDHDAEVGAGYFNSHWE
jgi:pimeloyl-ACP methyl ester carboxylesterase